MKKKKLKLNQLKVESFTTEVEAKQMRGGARWSKAGEGACPHLGEPTMDYLGCNSLDPFFCYNQSIDHPACVDDPGNELTIGSSVLGEF